MILYKEAARLGAKGYVKKPFLPQDLLAREEQIIPVYQRADERFTVN